MNKKLERKKYDVVIIGGGMSGICAALAASRHGAKTAIVHNRPVLGGNASSEVRMHIVGADCHGTRPDARETGILEEILLENKSRNPNHSFSIFDTVLWEKTHFQENLDVYLNTYMTSVSVENDSVVSVKAGQMTTEKVFEIDGAIFIDATGDGTLSYLSGAEYMHGREGKDIFGESYAPDTSDDYTMGSTLMFKAVDMGHPVSFKKPFWANSYTEEELKLRDHSEITSGYWWVEIGGGKFDTISDAEEIRDELMKAVYGIWDHIKNGGDHGAENYDLDWVQFLPGKRESRRIVGDYILKEQDLLQGRLFDDAVAYGGWPMDMHAVEGFASLESEPTNYIKLDNLFTIPYRCLYSKNIKNLMMAGRIISASHMAFGSIRVMGPCSVVGQAAGTAAAMAISKKVYPSGVMNYIKELQQVLLKDDCYIPGIKDNDNNDIARSTSIYASSCIEDGECINVINGISRKTKEISNSWISQKLGKDGQWICVDFKRDANIKEVHIKFDSNLSKEIMITLSKSHRDEQVNGLPLELIKDYDIEFYKNETIVKRLQIIDNIQRHRVHSLEEAINCSKVMIRVKSTYGDEHARIFEIRVY